MALANNINKWTNKTTHRTHRICHVEKPVAKWCDKSSVENARDKNWMTCQKFSPIYCILCSTAIPKKLSLILSKLEKKKYTTNITIIVYITMYLVLISFRLTSFFVSLFPITQREIEKERTTDCIVWSVFHLKHLSESRLMKYFDRNWSVACMIMCLRAYLITPHFFFPFVIVDENENAYYDIHIHWMQSTEIFFLRVCVCMRESLFVNCIVAWTRRFNRVAGALSDG